MRKVHINHIYQHYKGDKYIVVGTGTHSETLEEYVIYRALYGDGKVWIRPMSLFLDEIDHQKHPGIKQKYRFQELHVKSVAH